LLSAAFAIEPPLPLPASSRQLRHAYAIIAIYAAAIVFFHCCYA